MERSKIRIFAGIVSLAAWLSFLIFLKFLKATYLLDPPGFEGTLRIILLYFNIPLSLIFLSLGLAAGSIATLITCAEFVFTFESRIYAFPAFSLILVGFAAFRLRRAFTDRVKKIQIAMEKQDGEENLLDNELRLEDRDNSRMRSSLRRVAYLKEIIEDYSRTISEEDILNAIVRHSFEQFENSDRALLYLIDQEKQKLKLVRSKKKLPTVSIRAKEGDLFDKWMLKYRMPLIVDDTNKDFRFSVDKESDEGIRSLLSAPLMSENRILGLLRVDSFEPGRFNQSDLRFLDIIADISSVSLQNAFLYERVEDLAIHDSLTGLYVHRYFIDRMRHEVKRSLRNNTDFSLLMLDLDDFKVYNDTYGHNAGDLVLRHVAAILKSFARPGDLLSRYGGEEFCMLLLNREKAEGARLAEDVRKKISETPLILRRKKTTVTVSVGVASCPTEAKEAEELLRLADARLYNAKEKGKDMVCPA